jgi:D-glycero-alpha-D-manno-heptose-7-phosphate kinase
MFTPHYFLKYSEMERVTDVNEIQHPIMREALKLLAIPPAVEIVSLADIPAGTGLGSSGSFTVGLLRALHAHKCEYTSTEAIAEEACHVEMNLLRQPIGKQDQYIAAFGGLTCMEFQPSGNVAVSPLNVSRSTLSTLSDHLLMFFTGYSRSSTDLLGDQKVRTEKGDDAMVENLHFIKRTAFSIKDALEAGDTIRFAELMHEHWLYKRARSEGMSNPCIDHWYEVARANGAIGGKLIGAGGGGFLMLYTEDPRALRKAMAHERIEEVRFGFDFDGSCIVARD